MAADLSELTSWILNSLFLLVTKLSPKIGEVGGAGLLVLDGDDAGAGLVLGVIFLA